MRDDKQAPRELVVLQYGPSSLVAYTHHTTASSAAAMRDRWNRGDPTHQATGPYRYIRADIAAELARECLNVGNRVGLLDARGSTNPGTRLAAEWDSVLSRIAELESEP